MAYSKRDWGPDRDAFRRLLNWLDEGVDSGGNRYLEIRHRLALYFDRKNCLTPDELADETLNRVARKLQERGAITDLSPAHYCYITARFVFLESLRRTGQSQETIDDPSNRRYLDSSPALSSGTDTTALAREKLLDCLDECLNKLQQGDRELILEYYQGEKRLKIERRSQLAVRFGLSTNALSIRACRIRSKLELCVRTCAAGG